MRKVSAEYQDSGLKNAPLENYSVVRDVSPEKAVDSMIEIGLPMMYLHTF